MDAVKYLALILVFYNNKHTNNHLDMLTIIQIPVKTRDIEPMYIKCWGGITHLVITLRRCWVNVSCLLGVYIEDKLTENSGGSVIRPTRQCDKEFYVARISSQIPAYFATRA